MLIAENVQSFNLMTIQWNLHKLTQDPSFILSLFVCVCYCCCLLIVRLLSLRSCSVMITTVCLSVWRRIKWYCIIEFLRYYLCLRSSPFIFHMVALRKFACLYFSYVVAVCGESWCEYGGMGEGIAPIPPNNIINSMVVCMYFIIVCLYYECCM